MTFIHSFCCNAVRALVLEEIEAGVWLIQSISHDDIIRHPVHFLGKKSRAGHGAKSNEPTRGDGLV
jgi:hypothetical protein